MKLATCLACDANEVCFGQAPAIILWELLADAYIHRSWVHLCPIEVFLCEIFLICAYLKVMQDRLEEIPLLFSEWDVLGNRFDIWILLFNISCPKQYSRECSWPYICHFLVASQLPIAYESCIVLVNVIWTCCLKIALFRICFFSLCQIHTDTPCTISYLEKDTRFFLQLVVNV